MIWTPILACSAVRLCARAVVCRGNILMDIEIATEFNVNKKAWAGVKSAAVGRSHNGTTKRPTIPTTGSSTLARSMTLRMSRHTRRRDDGRPSNASAVPRTGAGGCLLVWLGLGLHSTTQTAKIVEQTQLHCELPTQRTAPIKGGAASPKAGEAAPFIGSA